MIASLFAAAALTSVAGDFNHDGRPDRAYVRPDGAAGQLVVELASGPVVVISSVESSADFYFEKLSPGTYATACAKGHGVARTCRVTKVDVRGDALQFGTREASQAAAVWENGRFAVYWLSD